MPAESPPPVDGSYFPFGSEPCARWSVATRDGNHPRAASAPPLSRSPMKLSRCKVQLLNVLMGCAYALYEELNSLLQQAGMAGHTHPPPALENPGVGEAAHVIVGLALIRAFGAVFANHDRSGLIESDFHPLHIHRGGLEQGILNVGQELGLVADLAVELSIGESVGHKSIQDRGIAVHLRLVPDVLQHDQFIFGVRSLGKSLPSGTQRQ